MRVKSTSNPPINMIQEAITGTQGELLNELTLSEIDYCGRQEKPAMLISRLLLRMRRMYVTSIRLDFH